MKSGDYFVVGDRVRWARGPSNHNDPKNQFNRIADLTRILTVAAVDVSANYSLRNDVPCIVPVEIQATLRMDMFDLVDANGRTVERNPYWPLSGYCAIEDCIDYPWKEE